QIGDRAAAARAVAEVVADDDVPGVQAADDQGRDEIVRADLAYGAEARAQQLLDAERREALEALAETREPRRRIGRRKELLRRRLEREHETALAPRVGLGARAREDCFVARVQAVEHADRHDARVRRRRERRDA